MRRLLIGALTLLLIPAASWAQDSAAIVRAKSLGTLLTQGKTLFDQIGLGATADKLNELVKSKTGPKGFTGIDPARPVGAFLKFDPDATGALVLPIVAENDFLALIERLDMKAVKEADGTYRIALPVIVPFPVYLKFADKHAWITAINKTAFAAKFDPQSLAGGSLASAKLRIDLFPNDARQIVIAQFEDMLQEAAKKNPPNETPAQKAFSVAWNQWLARQLGQVLNEGKEFSLDLDIDAASKELVVGAVLTPKADTPLAKSLAEAGKRTSVFAGPLPPSAFSARLTTDLPESVAKALGKVVEEAFKEGSSTLRDETKKKQAQDLWNAFQPIVDAGEIDAIVRFVGPDSADKLGVVAGIKAKSGDKFGIVFKTLAEDAKKGMPEAEQPKVMLDADSVGPVKIHRFLLPAKGPLGPAQDVLGDSTLSLAFRPDAVLAGIGADSLTGVKGLAAGGSPGAASIAQVSIDVSRLTPLIAPTPKIRAASRTLFPQAGDGVIQLTVQGGPTLRARLSVKTAVLQFLGQTREERSVEPKKD